MDAPLHRILHWQRIGNAAASQTSSAECAPSVIYHEQQQQLPDNNKARIRRGKGERKEGERKRRKKKKEMRGKKKVRGMLCNQPPSGEMDGMGAGWTKAVDFQNHTCRFSPPELKTASTNHHQPCAAPGYHTRHYRHSPVILSHSE